MVFAWIQSVWIDLKNTLLTTSKLSSSTVLSAREAHHLQSLTGDDTDKEDFVWLNGDMKLGEEMAISSV